MANAGLGFIGRSSSDSSGSAVFSSRFLGPCCRCGSERRRTDEERACLHPTRPVYPQSHQSVVTQLMREGFLTWPDRWKWRMFPLISRKACFLLTRKMRQFKERYVFESHVNCLNSHQAIQSWSSVNQSSWPSRRPRRWWPGQMNHLWTWVHEWVCWFAVILALVGGRCFLSAFLFLCDAEGWPSQRRLRHAVLQTTYSVDDSSECFWRNFESS